MKVSTLLWPVTVSAMLGIGSPVFAQEGPPVYEPPPSARRLAEDGFKLFKDGRYEEAAALLQQARAQFPAPQYNLYIGRSYEKLGKLVEAWEQLTAAAGMKPPADAPADFARKFERATALAAEDLASLNNTIPAVKLVVQGPSLGTVRVTATGTTIRVVPEGDALRAQMNVGEVDVEIDAPGFMKVKVHVKAILRSSGSPIEAVTITLEALPTPPPAEPPRAGPPPSSPSGSPAPTLRASPPGAPEPAGKETRPTDTFSHRMQLGAYARGDFQVTHGGAVAVVGISFAVHDFVEPYVGALLGRNVGVEPGSCFYFLRGTLKPRLDVAVPIFFEDTAYAGVRAAGGAQWDPYRNFGVFAQVGGAYFPVVPSGYNQFVFLPSVGVQGRL